METRSYVRHKFRNSLHALALFGAMTGLLSLVGWVVFGGTGLIIMAVSGTLALLFTPRVSPRLMLRFSNARVLSRHEAPGLHRVVGELARRSGVKNPPEIFYVDSPAANAFSVGARERAAIAVTGGLLRSMTSREITGILAHEMSHVRSGDMWVLGLAGVMTRMTRFLSMLGMILLLINLPLLFTGQWTISWWLILLLIFSPNISALLQLGLSRTREFNADADAALITGDPEGLASALEKLDRAEKSLLARLLMPGRILPQPSIFRTHPDTRERVRRLLELSGKYPNQPPPGGPSENLHPFRHSMRGFRDAWRELRS